MSRIRYTAEEQEKILKQVEQLTTLGKTQNEISKEVGVSKASIVIWKAKQKKAAKVVAVVKKRKYQKQSTPVMHTIPVVETQDKTLVAAFVGHPRDVAASVRDLFA